MSILARMFGFATWWNGATVGTRRFTSRHGTKVGDDMMGNVYFEGGTDVHGKPRRWVIYPGSNDSSRIPPEWHVWLHGTIDRVPEDVLPPPRPWQREPIPNLTGTSHAYVPAGALEAGGRRAAATGDYEAWSPDAA